MQNGEVAKIICEQHDKDVIFAAAIQAISFVAASGKRPLLAHMDYAMQLMQLVLDQNGVEMAAIIAQYNMKA